MKSGKKMQMFLIFLVFYCSFATGNIKRMLEERKGYNSTKMLQKVKEDHKFFKVAFRDTDIKQRETTLLHHSTYKTTSVQSKLFEIMENNAADSEEKNADDDDEEEEEEEEEEDEEADEVLQALNYMVIELQNNEKDIYNELMHAHRNRSLSCQILRKGLNISEASNRQITHKLTVKLRNLWKNEANNSEDVMMMLTCLESLVLDFKNAKWFNTLKGVSGIIFPMLNSSQSVFRREAALLFAWALQNCPQVQMTALHKGAIPILLEIVLNDTNCDVQILSMYSLEYLIKNFPNAQAKFVKDGGLLIMSQLFEREQDNQRILIKVVSMLHDLLLEHKHAIKSYPELDSRVKNVYRAVGLERELQKTGWCERIFRVLLDQVKIGDSRRRNSTSTVSGLPVKSNWANIMYDIDLPLVDICYSVFHIKSLEEKWFDLLLM